MIEYSEFKTVKEMDNHISMTLKTFDLKNKTRDILLLISRYSVKYVGVSYMKVSTIAKNVGCSERTVKRHLKVLVDYGIIKRIENMRKVSGGNGASITVICHTDLSHRNDDDNHDHTKDDDESDKNETINFKAKSSIKELNNVQDDVSYIKGTVEEWFINLSKPFFQNKLIKKLWKKANQCFEWYSSLGYFVDPSLVENAFKVSVYAYKTRKIHNFVGYFFSTLRNKIEDMERELSAKDRKQPSWLNWL